MPKEEYNIECMECKRMVKVIKWWDDGYNTKGTGYGLPPSMDMDLEFENCEHDVSDELYRDMMDKAVEKDKKMQERRQKVEREKEMERKMSEKQPMSEENPFKRGE